METEVRNLGLTVLQLVQQQGQNAQPLSVPLLPVQPVLLHSHGGLPKKFGGVADQKRNLVVLSELFMEI